MALPPAPQKKIEVVDKTKVDDLEKKVIRKIKYVHEKMKKDSPESQINDLREDMAALQKTNIFLDKQVKALKSELTKLKNVVAAIKPYVEPKPRPVNIRKRVIGKVKSKAKKKGG
jgi:hypothetical protein